MYWYLLRNRRHIGPFSVEQLESLKASGQLKRNDFALAQEHLEKGHVNYVPVSDLIFFPADSVHEVKSGEARSGSGGITHPQAPNVDAFQQTDGNYEAPLASFSDEELLSSEVSRVFTQLVESVDLAKGTHSSSSHTGHHRKSTGKTHFGIEPATDLPAPARGSSTDAEVSPWVDAANALKSPVGLLLLGVVVVIAGVVTLTRSGVFEKGIVKNVNEASSQVVSEIQPQVPSPAAPPAVPVISNVPGKPAVTPSQPLDNNSRRIFQGPIRLPSSGSRRLEQVDPEIVNAPPPDDTIDTVENRQPAGEEVSHGAAEANAAAGIVDGAEEVDPAARDPDSIDINQNGENNEEGFEGAEEDYQY